MTDIRSKLHRAIDLARAGRAFYNSGDHNLVRLCEEDLKVTYTVLDACLIRPRFVFARELVDAACTEDAERSICDMQRASIWRLPFKSMVVEPEVISNTSYVVLLDQPTEDGWFAANGFTIVHDKTDGQEALVVPLSSSRVDVATVDDHTYLKHTHVPALFLDNERQIVGERRFGLMMSEDAERTSAAHGLAAVLATVMMQTLGLERQTTDVGAAFNKKRTERGKSVVSPYVYVHVRRVYRSESGDESDEHSRCSPRPHWRRGHARRVAVGTGRSDREWRWIPPRMVALAEGQTVLPPARRYKVLK